MGAGCAVYVRLSRDDRGDQTSTSRQARSCSALAEARGWEVVEVFEDVDLSAYRPGVVRPAYERLLSAVARGDVERVVVWKLDRLARSLKDLVNTLDDLSGWGVDFISHSDRHVDTTTPTGKLVFQIIGAVAEFERELTRERVKAGLENARRKGKRLGRKPLPPYVYEEAKNLVAEGLSNRAIGKRLGISEGAIRNRRKAEGW